MPTTADFLTATRWSIVLTLGCFFLALLGFVFRWGIRFRLVGIASFMGVLTGGLFALGLTPFTRTVIPGAVPYTTVYDTGAAQAVIAVAPTITATELDATLRQAASNLFSSGRLSQGEAQLTIRARTLLHPEPGLTKPLYLGSIKRSLRQRNDATVTVELDGEALSHLSAISDPPLSTE